MRTRTLTVVSILLLLFAGVGAYGFTQGFSAGEGSLTEHWVTDTARDTIGNHHVPAAKQIGGEPLIVAPVNANDGQGCTLVAVNNQSKVQWRDSMPSKACNIHGYGDPIFADFDRDGTQEVFVATTEEAIVGLSAKTGAEEFRYNLSWWGYAAPIVTDFTSAPGRELTVVDLSGGIFVLRQNETVVWKANVSSVVAPPKISDFDADGSPELAVGEGQNVTLLNRSGGLEQQTHVKSSVNWMTTGQADEDGALEIVVGTLDGRVVTVDGGTGTVEWTKKLGSNAAVRAFGDGDADGLSEVYAVAEDGKLRAISANNGTVEWTTTLTTEDVQMTPPPRLANLDGDSTPELVVPSQDGAVSIVNPATGAVLVSYERDVPIWTFPALATIDGDEPPEILQVYGDGRTVALSYETS